MIMRSVWLIIAVMGGSLLASCASSRTSNFVADNLPEWAGGEPRGTPPRVGTPGYDAYVNALSGNDGAATATSTSARAATNAATIASPAPVAAPKPPPRQHKDPVDEPNH